MRPLPEDLLNAIDLLLQEIALYLPEQEHVRGRTANARKLLMSLHGKIRKELSIMSAFWMESEPLLRKVAPELSPELRQRVHTELAAPPPIWTELDAARNRYEQRRAILLDVVRELFSSGSGSKSSRDAIRTVLRAHVARATEDAQINPL